MKALLVVDMINDFVAPNGALYIGPVAEQVVPEVKARLDHHRSANNPVFFACDQHIDEDREFDLFPPHSVQGSGGDEVFSEVAPKPNERVIGKRRFSAFFGTDLDLTLREKGIEEIELVGVVSNICILYTAAEARMLGYRVTVPQKAVASFDEEAHRFALQEMDKTLGVNLI